VDQASVFISHSSQDHETARTICDALESRGLKCWIATRDVGPGQNYQDSIVRSIRASRAMVLVFSTNANGSQEILKELALASKYKVSVIPARIDDAVPLEAFEFEFATRQWIDLFENWEREIERLATSVARFVTVDPTAASAAHPEASGCADESQAPVASATVRDVPSPATPPAGKNSVRPVPVAPRSRGWLDPRGYLGTAMMIGIATGVLFGFGMTLITGTSDSALLQGVLFGALFGPCIAIFMQGATVRIPEPWSPELSGRLQMAMAEIGYLPRSNLGHTLTFKPSFYAGLLAGSMTISGYTDHVDVFGPRFYVKRLLAKIEAEMPGVQWS
jgi:hypothetical protein